MKRGTLTKFAALCEYHGWRMAMQELEQVPGCKEMAEAVDKLHGLMLAEKHLAKAKAIAGVAGG